MNKIVANVTTCNTTDSDPSIAPKDNSAGVATKDNTTDDNPKIITKKNVNS